MTDSDPTVRIATPRGVPRAAPGPAPLRARGLPLMLGAAAVAAVGIAGGVWWWRGAEAPEPPPKPDLPGLATPAPSPRAAPDQSRPAAPDQSRPAAPATPAPPAAPLPRQAAELGPPIATQAEILANRATAPMIFRLDANPRVFLADFPNLDRQGATFNRVAALVEKAGLPRDRVLDDAALAAAIARTGDTPGTYYYGHNYRGRDLERFFALAARDGVALNPDEAWLREELTRIRRLVPAPGEFAVVSVPGIEERVDAAMREAILQHEIGHGHFFADARFAAHVERVWRDTFTEAERTAFRAFLAREGYDPAIEEVMINEAMAYMIFTPDPRFFQPAHAGLTDERAEVLRAALREGAPR